MLIYSRAIFAGTVILSCALSVCGHIGDSRTIANSSSIRAHRFASESNVAAHCTLVKGDKEFGFSAGGAFKATTVFGGLTEADSNGDRTGSNRGLNQFVFYAGFSVFK
jgi:hypothetical protein